MSAAIEKGLYQHYKGPFYQVLGSAKHSETEDSLVVYRALYGDFGLWVRPVQMFAENVVVNSKSVPRFQRIEPQTGVLEVAILDVKPGLEDDFQSAFTEAQAIISSKAGFIDLSLQRCVENSSRFLLLVNWMTLEHHTQGFRESPEYQEWSKLLHRFYEPFPEVQHYSNLLNIPVD